MKKIWAVVLILFLTFSLSQAAVKLSAKGLVLGVNLANISGVGGLAWSLKPGLLIGGFLTFSLADFLAVEPEFLYSQKGAVNSEDITQGVIRTSINLSYLEIPILLKIIIPLGEDILFRPHFYGGPSFGAKLSGKIQVTFDNPYGGDSDTSTLEGIKKTEIGFVVGAGVAFEVKGGKFILDARYGQSLSTISIDPPTKKNKVFTFILGYSFE